MCAVFEPQMMWYENGSKAMVAIEDFSPGAIKFTVWLLELSGENRSKVVGRGIDEGGVEHMFRTRLYEPYEESNAHP